MWNVKGVWPQYVWAHYVSESRLGLSAQRPRQMMAWRSLAETHSPTTTVATMMSTMTLTLDQARLA